MKKIPIGSISLGEAIYLLTFTIIMTVAICLFLGTLMLVLIGMGIIVETFIPKDFLPRQEVRNVILYSFLALNIFLRYRRKASQQKLDVKPDKDESEAL